MVSGTEKCLEAFAVGYICFFFFHECNSTRQQYSSGEFLKDDAVQGSNRLFYTGNTLVPSLVDLTGGFIYAFIGTVSLEGC